MDDKLSDAELESLRIIVDGTPAQETIPVEHARKLIHLDFVELRQGGLIATGKGRMRAKTAPAAAR